MNRRDFIYSGMGIDPEKHIMADGNRLVSIVKDGKVVTVLLC